MNDIIQSLWIGGTFSKMERLSAQSFIDCGHEYHLYTYGKVENVPEGVIIKNGEEILSKNEIFTYKNGSYSAFSNYFRFHLLHKKGGYWADTDLICVKKFNFKAPYVIVSEPDSKYNRNIPTSCLIKLPKKSNITSRAIQIQKHHKKLILSGRLRWSSGPMTINDLVKTFNLHKYVLPWNSISSCYWNDAKSIVDPSFKNDNNKIIRNINNLPSNMVAIHLWNECWRQNKLDKNGTYDENSLYEQLKKRYNID